MGKSTVMAQFNRGFGGVEDHRVQFRQLEVVGVGPIANLVGGGNGTNAPEPCLSGIEGSVNVQRLVRDVKPVVVPGGVGQTVNRREVALGIELNDVAGQRHASCEIPYKGGLSDGGQVDARAD